MICRVCKKIVKTNDPQYLPRRVCKKCLPTWKRKSPEPKLKWTMRGVCPTTDGIVKKNYHTLK